VGAVKFSIPENSSKNILLPPLLMAIKNLKWGDLIDKLGD
jgi:hypothetical protein